MADKCLVCNLAVVDELACSRCPRQCHISCITGCPVNNNKTRTMIKNGVFLCHVCVVSRQDELTISAMQQNQQLHRENQIGFPLPDNTTVGGGDDDKEEEAEDGSDEAAVATPEQRVADSGVQDAGGAGGNGDTETNHPATPAVLAPIHKNCEFKSRKLLTALKNMLTIPKHASTLLIGDSLAHYLDKKVVDQESDTLRIRSISGLCVPATVKALSELDRSYGNFKRVIYSLGTNDHLHRAKHCFEERSKYYKSLEEHTARIFPNAVINIVVPYVGMKNLQKSDIAEQIKLVRESCTKIKVHTPPSLVHKVQPGGVHPDTEGEVILTNFYRKRFFPRKPRVFNKSSGKHKVDVSYAQAHLQGSNTSDVIESQRSLAENRGSFRVPLQQPQHPMQPPPPMRQTYPVQQQCTGVQSQGNHMVWEIADALTHMLTIRRSEPSQPTYTANRQWC